ncbi:MAG: AraC family transcriptional regulator, partial [Bacteroidota bacterium]
LTLEELAFLCNMSISTFKRHFQQIYEVAPSRWFREKRLQRAEYLLRVQHQKPSEVYREVGFENLSSFTQAFKKHFGTTPKKYQAAQH